jgi:putative ABC transport system ATP-binding protein
MGATLIEAQNLQRTYRLDGVHVPALRDVSLAIERGEFVAIMGPSGSGKSTFLNIIGCLDRPDRGRYILDGIDTSSMSPDDRADIRNRKIGFVFQGFNLLPRMPALENVELPMLYANAPHEIRRQRARKALTQVGLADRVAHEPTQLSGGQQQRVAIARALVNEPQILLADEPTGNLDTQSGREIMEILSSLNRERGLTILLVTHEHDIAMFAARQIEFRDGQIVRDELVRSAK